MKLLALFGLLLSSQAMGQVTLPYTFSPYTPIASAQVNANFSATANELNAFENLTASGGIGFAFDTGVANAYVVSVATYVTQLTSGFSFIFIPTNTNTGASTISVNSLAPVSITLPGGVPVGASEMVAGFPVQLVYNGSTFQIVSNGNELPVVAAVSPLAVASPTTNPTIYFPNQTSGTILAGPLPSPLPSPYASPGAPSFQSLSSLLSVTTQTIPLANSNSSPAANYSAGQLTSGGVLQNISTGTVANVMGIVQSGGGVTTGNAQVAVSGLAMCSFDGNSTAGDIVTLSTSTGGYCHDTGSSQPLLGGVMLGKAVGNYSGPGIFPMMVTVQTIPAQGQYVGTATWAETSGCIWTQASTSTSFTNFPAQTSCPNPTFTGPWTSLMSAAGTKIPAVVFSGLPKGTLQIVASGNFQNYSSGGGQDGGFRFTDGTHNSAPVALESVVSSTTTLLTVPHIVGELTYTSRSNSPTVQMQGVIQSSSVTLTITANDTVVGAGLVYDFYFYPAQL